MSDPADAAPPESRTVTMTPDELNELCESAVLAAGGSSELAQSLAASAVAADRRGKTQVGTAHLVDYLDALDAGRINGSAGPALTSRLPAAQHVDADSGTAQLAFDTGFEPFIGAADRLGVAMLSITNSYTAGELGHYADRIAQRGLVALVTSNSPALMSVYGAEAPVTGTNPLAFAVPHPEGPRFFDQASSETAWVNIRDAATHGADIPAGQALGPDGSPTTDAHEALAGALLPFGGVKGSNIALMVEFLASLGGGRFSLDAPSHAEGSESPGIGLTAIAISPEAFDPGYVDRVADHLDRLHRDFGIDFGRKRSCDVIEIPAEVHAALAHRR
ncbi:Ldh family oxidoreductase [Brevibacterium atlanticum]|uniref:Ldh family oxidoreductase n=1 Tax=Brevibacterium atlanticum TaxID=2697563 RepID=UPI0014228FE5|nr:Ldh family oxidoreductase [Brevibacterium atlanticum]